MLRYVRNLASLLISKRYRRYPAIAAIALTVLLAVNFFMAHPDYLSRLGSVSPTVIILVVILNIPVTAALAWAYDAMLNLCGKRLPTKENVLLTAYSSIINFFGPLQSGPGVRAAYLKVRHGVRVRDFMLATLLYYAFFAGFSAIFLLAGVRPWWQTVLLFLVTIVCSAGVIGWFTGKIGGRKPKTFEQFHLRRGPLLALAVAVFIQLACISAYYFVELRAVDPHIGVGQAISYSGAANFSLFVSFTPDAVGIREGFLIFSQSLHHISTADIVNANIIDRGSYVIYLGLLFLFMLSIHARDRLRLTTLDKQSDSG
jgi:uncharacterized membrane protein YbhN (UPF0104 family)